MQVPSSGPPSPNDIITLIWSCDQKSGPNGCCIPIKDWNGILFSILWSAPHISRLLLQMNRSLHTANRSQHFITGSHSRRHVKKKSYGLNTSKPGLSQCYLGMSRSDSESLDFESGWIPSPDTFVTHLINLINRCRFDLFFFINLLLTFKIFNRALLWSSRNNQVRIVQLYQLVVNYHLVKTGDNN